jgi:hypothetical protein
MDPRFLVSSDRIETAARLFAHLQDGAFDLQGAMWAQSEGDAQPYLYLVTKQLVVDGPIGAYKKFNAAFHAFQRAQTNPFRALELDDIKLLAPHESRAAELLWYLGRYPDDQPTYRSHCGVPTEAAYIYPAARTA